MKRALVRLLASVSMLVMCGACDVARNAFRPIEERVSEAFPVSGAVSAAQTKVRDLMGAEEQARADFDREYVSRLRLRALTCAPGIEIGAADSAADIRARVENPKCFDEYDTKLARELSLRRVGMLLLAEALRPVPAELPPRIAATNDIVLADFAREAGVALVTSSRALEVIDIGADRSIYLDTDPGPFAVRAALSPNGRVFAIASISPDSTGVRLRDSATGEVLIELPGVGMFEWLDSSTAWITTKDIRGSELLEVATGRKWPMRGIASVPTQMLRVPGADPVFVARSGAALTRFALRYTAGEPQVTVLGTQTTPGLNWTAGISTTTVDGSVFVQGGQRMAVSDLATLETQELSIAPFSARGISPLPRADEVLMSVFVPSGGIAAQKFFVFNVRDLTFAPIEDERFSTSPGLSAARTYYVPSANRIVLVAGATMSPLTDFKRGFRLGRQAFGQHLMELDQEYRAAMVRSSAPRGSPAPGDDAAPGPTGNVAELARDAQIEAVGVYESAAAPRGRPGQPSGRGPVQVVVRRASKPIVLVLTSYESVDWQVRVESGARLRAVLLAGYEGSTVSGIGALRALNIGRLYAYQQGSAELAQLQAEVVRWAGRPIDTFQGTYRGGAFTVGGR